MVKGVISQKSQIDCLFHVLIFVVISLDQCYTSPTDTLVLFVLPYHRDKGANGSVRYRLSEQTTTTHPGLFHIGSTSGELKVMRSLDREMESSYEVHVIAHDLGPIQLSSEVSRLR